MIRFATIFAKNAKNTAQHTAVTMMSRYVMGYSAYVKRGKMTSIDINVAEACAEAGNCDVVLIRTMLLITVLWAWYYLRGKAIK